MENQAGTLSCQCASKGGFQSLTLMANTKKTAKSIPSALLGVLIAFFPKCPLCWAVYMSMFSSLGLSRLPYLKWLLPVLIIFLALHIFLLYRRIKRVGYFPLITSTLGAVFILCSRLFFPFITWPLLTGVICIVIGSLLNSFPIMAYTSPKRKAIIQTT